MSFCRAVYLGYVLNIPSLCKAGFSFCRADQRLVERAGNLVFQKRAVHFLTVDVIQKRAVYRFEVHMEVENPCSNVSLLCRHLLCLPSDFGIFV